MLPANTWSLRESYLRRSGGWVGSERQRPDTARRLKASDRGFGSPGSSSLDANPRLRQIGHVELKRDIMRAHLLLRQIPQQGDHPDVVRIGRVVVCSDVEIHLGRLEYQRNAA